MKGKVKTHLFTLPRWFAIPFFGCSALLGSVLAGGSLSELNAWLGFVAVALGMASGHAQNTFWDWHVGLDAPEEGSIEKGYTGGAGVIAKGKASPREVLLNAAGFYLLALILVVILSFRAGPYILIPFVAGAAVPYFYTRGKFSWYHETVLALGVVTAVIIGMFAVNPSPAWWEGLVVALPTAMILSYLGLAFDEWGDAYTNLKKGTKSLAYKVWEYKFDLATYILAWLIIVYCFQVFLIAIGILKPLTMLSLVAFPLLLTRLVLLKPHVDALRENPMDEKNLEGFNKSGKVLVLVAMLYPILMLVGQAIG